MPRPDSQNRLSQTQRSGNVLANFLNAPADTELHVRVMEVFRLCRQLDELRQSGALEHTRTDGLQRAINAHLAEFLFSPVLNTQHPYSVFWRPSSDSRSRAPVKPLTAAVLAVIPPSGAIKCVLDMTEQGTLGRVRQCVCGKWFFAQTNKKVVCRDACRFRKFKQKDEDGFREERAEYMRDYRSNARVKARKRKEKPNARTTK